MGTAPAKTQISQEQELDELISELDAIQKDLGTPGKANLKVVPSGKGPEDDETQEIEELDDFVGQGGASEGSLEETLGQLEKEEPAKGSLLATATETAIESAIDSEEEVAPVQEVQEHVESFDALESESGAAGALSMTLSGSVTLNLKYAYNGQEVKVAFEDSFLKVVLTDGTEFKIPVGKKVIK